MVYVIKFDGREQDFNKQKIIRTCLRMHATPKIAKKVADKIAEQAYDGITTKKIMQMIFAYLRKERPEFKHVADLRAAISALRPKPDFEKFIAQLLRAHGYKVKTNRIVNGRCIDHEIDSIAEKGKDIIYVEVKHHYKPHTYTGLGYFLEANSTFEDMVDGYGTGANKIKFNKSLIISNTKLSAHAKRYADCRKIMYIGWKAPAKRGLERMIEEKCLYPITMIRGIDPMEEMKLGDAGIVTIKQILDASLEELWKKTKIPKKRLKDLNSKAQNILSLCEKNHQAS
jgi:hypothetical protein